MDPNSQNNMIFLDQVYSLNMCALGYMWGNWPEWQDAARRLASGNAPNGDWPEWQDVVGRLPGGQAPAGWMAG